MPKPEETQETPEPVPEKTERVYAGKFKSPDDLEKSYSELEKKLGEQGSRLGDTEKERSFLLSQLEHMQSKNQAAPAQDTATDFDAELAAVSAAIEEGELSISEGIKKTAQISAQMASANAVNGVRQAQERQVIEGSKAQFAKQNPDFFEMQRSGALEEVKSSLPGFHDDVSAFFAYKAQQTQNILKSELETTRAKAFEEGKAEMAKLAGGDKNTQKVLQSGGKSANEIGRKTGPMKQSEMRESGLNALNKARGG